MKRIKEERQKLNMLQKEVAELISMDRTTYAKYETGSILPPVDVLIRLADLFNVSVDYLIEHDMDNRSSEDLCELKEIEALYKKLNEDGRETAMNTMRALAAYPDMINTTDDENETEERIVKDV